MVGFNVDQPVKDNNAFSTISGSLIEDGTRFNPDLHIDAGFNPFCSDANCYLSDYFTSAQQMYDAMLVGHESGDGSAVEFKSVSVGRGTQWQISFLAPLDHTKFEFVNPDHETEITSWMSSASVANLVEVLITESPTQPNIDALSPTDIASAFNSPSLSLKCGETWNGQLAPTQQTKMVITRDNSGIPEPFNYSAIAQTAPILSSGKWSGVGGGFANNNALGQVKSPKIMYFHFEKASGTKVKFSNGDPSGSHCGIS